MLGHLSRTPSQVLAASKTAAASESSLHYVATTKTSTNSVTITGDVSKTEGQQTIVAIVNGQVGHVTVMLVGGSAYFEGDEPGLATFMGLPQSIAVRYANKWISLSSSDADFSAVAAGLTTSTALLQSPISNPLTLRGMSEKSGRQVLAIGGFDSGIPGDSTRRSRFRSACTSTRGGAPCRCSTRPIEQSTSRRSRPPFRLAIGGNRLALVHPREPCR